MDLYLQDTITLWTPTGDCKIQLMYGDITKHSIEDKVDLIMVSAFPGDYAAVRRTVIGALWHNLGINVENLSMNKELDLRSLFHCWLSPPLKEHCPFKKLLCFERKRGTTSMFEQIRDLFRVFVPVFSNKETTVITPLLATGNQGFSKTLCLSAMVEGAAGWICAGLSLRCLKIVLYEKPNQDVNELFTQLKGKWIKKSEKLKSKSAMTKNYLFDVYIMFDQSDEKNVQTVESMLAKKKRDISVYTKHPKFDENKVWQGNIYKNMILSKKIVAILTPAFVKSEYCLELFNMAMCCGRLCKREMLLPFYFEQVDSMPVYMGLIQYFDCRIKRAGENRDTKVENACVMIINELKDNKDGSVPVVEKNKEDLPKDEEETYDLFISYCHKNTTEAKTLFDMYSERNPDLKIFFDRNELTMGNLWQSSLYQAMSGARCVVCLISSAYINSTVCQEEYNIALARYLSESEDILFVPVCIEELQEVPYWFSQVKMVDARGDNFDFAAKEVMKNTLQWLKDGNVPDFVCKNQKLLHIGDIYPEIREKDLERKFVFNKISEVIEPKTELKFPPVNAGKDHSVVISHAHDSLYCSVFLGNLLEKHIPNININYVSDDTHGRMHLLDTARKIVIFLSNDFVHSAQHMQELHIALVRQRSSKGKRIVHIIQTTELPDKPMFLKLIPCAVSLKDAFWEKFCKKHINKQGPIAQRKHIRSQRSDFPGTFSCSLSDYLAFVTASYDVVEDFAVNKKQREVKSEPNQVNILKMKLYLEPEEIQKKWLSSMVPVNSEILVNMEVLKEENENGYVLTKEVRGQKQIKDAIPETTAARTDGTETTTARADNRETIKYKEKNDHNIEKDESLKTKVKKTGDGQVNDIDTNSKNSKETTASKTDIAKATQAGGDNKETRKYTEEGVNNESSKTKNDETGDSRVNNINSKNSETKADVAQETKEKSNDKQDKSNERNTEIRQVESQKATQKRSQACVVL